MLDRLRTIPARFIVDRLRGAPPLLVAAWLWLAAETEDLDEKRPCLEAVLELKAESQAARAGLALLHQRQVSGAEKASFADDGSRC